jgi:hypothetical protein
VSTSLWPEVAIATAISGIVAAIAEIAFVLPIQWSLGTPPVTLFQSIAYGALGKAAFQGGLSTAALGLFFHVLISLVAAGLYTGAALSLPALFQRPIVGGMLYGLAVFVVMVFVVIPLSAIGFQPLKSLPRMATSIAVHIFAFGLPLALTSTSWIRYARARQVGLHPRAEPRASL